MSRKTKSRGKPEKYSRHFRQFAGPIVILVAAALAVWPLVMIGPSCGPDFSFHLVSWIEAQRSFLHGILYPHWASGPNFGAGEPRFVFYPPLTWMAGALLGLIVPWPVVSTVLAYLLLAATGLANRALARQMMADGPATLAGCASIFLGNMLVGCVHAQRLRRARRRLLDSATVAVSTEQEHEEHGFRNPACNGCSGASCP